MKRCETRSLESPRCSVCTCMWERIHDNKAAQAVKPEVAPAAGGTAMKKILFGLSSAQQQLKSSDLGVILDSIYQAVPTLQMWRLILSESSRIRDCEQQEPQNKSF